jgi:hypothetical protein
MKSGPTETLNCNVDTTSFVFLVHRIGEPSPLIAEIKQTLVNELKVGRHFVILYRCFRIYASLARIRILRSFLKQFTDPTCIRSVYNKTPVTVCTNRNNSGTQCFGSALTLCGSGSIFLSKCGFGSGSSFKNECGSVRIQVARYKTDLGFLKDQLNVNF